MVPEKPLKRQSVRKPEPAGTSENLLTDIHTAAPGTRAKPAEGAVEAVNAAPAMDWRQQPQHDFLLKQEEEEGEEENEEDEEMKRRSRRRRRMSRRMSRRSRRRRMMRRKTMRKIKEGEDEEMQDEP